MIDIERFLVPSDRHISLSDDYDTGYTNTFVNKDDAKKQLKAGVKQLAKYQDVLYAQNIYSLLLVFQAMDAAGKDSTIKHVMSGINPQGCQRTHLTSRRFNFNLNSTSALFINSEPSCY